MTGLDTIPQADLLAFAAKWYDVPESAVRISQVHEKVVKGYYDKIGVSLPVKFSITQLQYFQHCK